MLPGFGPAARSQQAAGAPPAGGPTLPSKVRVCTPKSRCPVLRARTQLASIKGAVGSTRPADHDAASVSLAGTFIGLWHWQSNLNATWAPDLAP